MRNRKDSVGAKAAAWVGITLGAVVFFRRVCRCAAYGSGGRI
ncbi:MAG: hypothetical protein ACLTIG_11445 [Roseburia hominis]